MLYRSELRRNRIFALLMFIAHNKLLLYSMFAVEMTRVHVDKESSFVFYLFFVILGCLPLILYYSFVPRQSFNTKHLLFPLPVPRSMYMTARYCALVSMALYIVLGYLLLILQPLNSISRTQEFLFPNGHWLIHYFSRTGFIVIFNFIAPIALMAGLVCAADSLHHAIKRFTSVARFIFFMVSLLGVLWSMKYLASHVFVLPDFSSRGIEVIEEIMILYYPAVSAYAVLVGLLFLLLGIFVDKKYADV